MMSVPLEKDALTRKILDEKVEYVGVINFASRGIEPTIDGLIRAFNYGMEVGIECAKIDAVKIIEGKL